jgi:hypothetical protein
VQVQAEQPGMAAGSKLERSELIPDGVHAELRRLGVKVTRFVEDFMGARLRLRRRDEPFSFQGAYRTLEIPRTAYVGDHPVEAMDTISHGEVVSNRFEIEL